MSSVFTCFVLVQPDHLIESLPAHEDDHPGDHQVHGDNHQVHGDNHQVLGDNHLALGDNHPAHIEDHLSHAANSDLLVLVKDHQVRQNLGEKPVHLALESDLLILQSPVLVAGHQVLAENLMLHTGHPVQISYHPENP